ELPARCLIGAVKCTACCRGGGFDLHHEIAELLSGPPLCHVDGRISRIGNDRHAVGIAIAAVAAFETFKYVYDCGRMRGRVSDGSMNYRFKNVGLRIAR